MFHVEHWTKSHQLLACLRMRAKTKRQGKDHPDGVRHL